jgi:hypothetical protein
VVICREGNSIRSAGEKPTDLAFVSEGFQLTNRSAEMERRKVPPLD